MSLQYDTHSGMIMDGPGCSVAFVFQRHQVPFLVNSVELFKAAAAKDQRQVELIVAKIKAEVKALLPAPVPV